MFRKKKTSNLKDYNSSEILLKILQKEYEYDLNNINALYNRSGIIFAFIGVYFGALGYNAINLNVKMPNKALDFLAYLALIVLYIIAIILALISTYYLFKVILVAKYERIDISKGFDEESAKIEKDVVCYYMMNTYKKLLISNLEVIKQKHTNFERSEKFLIRSLIVFIFYIFITYIKEGRL